MADMPIRLVVAYALIALLLLAAAGLAWWLWHNTWQRRHRRDQSRTEARNRKRDNAAAEAAAEH